jgi:hypothetical protein
LSIIEQEMRQMNNSSRQRVELIPELVLRTETLRTAYQKYAQGTVAAAILEPASLPEPPAEESDTDAWREAVQRAKISYEAERIRSMQLEIEKEEGSDTSAAGLWKRYHQKVLEPQLAVLQERCQNQPGTAAASTRRISAGPVSATYTIPGIVAKAVDLEAGDCQSEKGIGVGTINELFFRISYRGLCSVEIWIAVLRGRTALILM